MDFGAIPPEVNSARMYSGPGAGPLLAAATAWSGLAAELELSATAWQSVLGDLITWWSGPSSVAMSAAAAPHISWLHGASAVAEQTAAQAHAAAAAFETAFAMTVPPPVVAANRSLVLMLTATNFFGQNTPAIAAAEAAYAGMWAQDAAAMYGYAGAAASATVLTPFTPPSQATEAVGPLEEASGAVEAGRAAGTAATNTAQQALTKLSSALHAAAAPAEAAPPAAELPSAAAIELALIPVHLGLGLFGAGIIDGLGVVAIDLPGAVGATLLKEIAAERTFVLVGTGSPGPVAAGMGQAVPMSGLSVPGAWSTATGTERPISLTSAKTVAREEPDTAAQTFSPGLAGMAGLHAMAGRGAGQRNPTPTGRVRPPKASTVPEVDIATELRELMDLHGSGVLTDTEFAKEKERLFAE